MNQSGGRLGRPIRPGSHASTGGYIGQQSGCIGVGFAIPADTAIYYVRNGTIQRIIDASTGSGAWYYSQGRWARAVTPTGPTMDRMWSSLWIGMPVTIYSS